MKIFTHLAEACITQEQKIFQLRQHEKNQRSRKVQHLHQPSESGRKEFHLKKTKEFEIARRKLTLDLWISTHPLTV